MRTAGSGMVKKKKDESNIDLTPMLDVVFILLIFFVVTASFVKESTLGVQGQDQNNNPPPPDPDQPQNILIQLDARDQIFFNQERIDIAAVRARVASHRAENPAASVVIQTNGDSTANTLVMVMNASREAGANDISVMPARN